MLRAVGLLVAVVAVAGSSAGAVRADEKGFLGIAFKASEDPKGFAVEQVVPDGPAEKAGVKVGDVITKVDGKALGELQELADYVGGKKPGDKLALTLSRDGKETELKVTL